MNFLVESLQYFLYVSLHEQSLLVVFLPFEIPQQYYFHSLLGETVPRFHSEFINHFFPNYFLVEFLRKFIFLAVYHFIVNSILIEIF